MEYGEISVIRDTPDADKSCVRLIGRQGRQNVADMKTLIISPPVFQKFH